MDKESKAYKSGEFYEFFQESEIANLAKEDIVEYRKSNMRYWEDQAVLDYATRKGLNEGRAEGREEGRAEGREEGRAEGREEGLAEGRKTIAKNLIDMGMDAESISKATGLSAEEIDLLR